jgi:aryl-alcohol dehydrogenase-like predicted oxidoreductase
MERKTCVLLRKFFLFSVDSKRLFVFPEGGYFRKRHCDLLHQEYRGARFNIPTQHPLRNIDVTVRQEQNGQRGIASGQSSAPIPLKSFGKTGIQISALGLGGHHLGAAKDEQTAVEIVHRAVDGGITFFDCCWEYNRGKSEDWLGKGVKGRRDKVFLMTEVCTHGRDAALATQMLEQRLRRLQTDHLDLWQIHGVGFENDPDLFIRTGGAAEALTKARKDGKVRFVGFTGHKDPDVHLAMLNTGFHFDAVQMPLNPFDANFSSFEQNVLPALNQRGIAALAMKPIGGHGEPVQKGVFTAAELLRYSMSLPAATPRDQSNKAEFSRRRFIHGAALAGAAIVVPGNAIGANTQTARASSSGLETESNLPNPIVPNFQGQYGDSSTPGFQVPKTHGKYRPAGVDNRHGRVPSRHRGR